MKKTFFFAFLFMAFLVVPYSIAQKSTVTAGVVKFETGDFDQALEKLNTALDNPSQLDDKSKAKAWLYKGKTLISILSEAS